MLARVGLAQAAEKLAGKYSRGIRKRLGIARKLLIMPRLVLLDEPYSGLDPEGQEELSRLLTSLAEYSAVVVSSHDLHTLELAFRTSRSGFSFPILRRVRRSGW